MDDIADITGLSKEEIDTLYKSGIRKCQIVYKSLLVRLPSNFHNYWKSLHNFTASKHQANPLALRNSMSVKWPPSFISNLQQAAPSRSV